MRFTLHYRGPLRATGDPSHKHELRRVFHAQLAVLWQQAPLVGEPKLLHPQGKAGEFSSLRPLGAFSFVPLATEEMKVVAELAIVMLRPGPIGQIITQGGDIDNRLKTLFDALAKPPHLNAIPTAVGPGPSETPFFCLLEDDKLITSVSVRTDQLLESVSDQAEVDLSIQVRIRAVVHLWGNGMFQ